MDMLNIHPFVRATLANKALGTIVGSALGDVVGLYTEFLPKTACFTAYPDSKFSLLQGNVTKFREDSHRDKFEPGDWTDDTDQSLLILLSFLHSFGKSQGMDKENKESAKLSVNPQDVAVRIKDWISQGLRALNRPPLGIGQTIGRVVLDPDYITDPAAVALKIWLKSNKNAAPNGSLMRTHPIGVICFGMEEKAAFEVAAKVSRITHVDPRCIVACCIQVGLVRAILRGEIDGEEDMNALIERAWDWVNSKPLYRNPEHFAKEEVEGEWEEVGERIQPESKSLLDELEFRKHCYAETLQELQLDDSQKMGYVYKCLGTAIFCLRKAMRKEQDSLLPTNSSLFEELISDLTMEGGDADTNACAAGALLGAWLGYDKLPAHWEQGIHNRNWLLKKCQALLYRLDILKVSNGNLLQMVERDPDTALDGGKGFLSKEDLDRRERDFVMMILLKQKERREEVERQERAKKSGLAKWFKQGH